MQNQNFNNTIYNIFGFLPRLTFSGLIEILILSFLIYKFLMWIKNTKSWNLLKGIFIIMGFIVIAVVCNFTVILWLLEQVAGIAVITIVIIFQNDLRQALERIGRHRYFRMLLPEKIYKNRIYEKTILEITKAVFDMAKVKTGALIVIEQNDDLSDIEKTGIKIDGEVSSALLINIFEKNTPLHDGAVVISGNIIKSATCYLPLSERQNISKDLGTRHRAAIGMSEKTDSYTIVVSEETGQVSFVVNGQIQHMDTEKMLQEELIKVMTNDDVEKKETNIDMINKLREYLNEKTKVR